MIIGTAGHIDHGKTALVRALTGVDTDRLPEEKRRGITIELGFAPLRLADGRTLGVVDVPGHEAFVRTMVAGSTGVDLALLVVAADEGVMPQTREHLDILSLLGVRGGVVALTKCDLTDDEWLPLVKDEVAALLEGSALESAPVVAVSAKTGAGLEELRATIAAAADRIVRPDDEDFFRLPVDRVFTLKGTGTVVTGTVWSGELRRGHAWLYPPGRLVRVRELQNHGAPVESVVRGMRAAVALANVSVEDVERGSVLVTGEWQPTETLRCQLVLGSEAGTRIAARTRVRLHIASAEVGARVVPVAQGFARLHLDKPIVCRAGDRFVIRGGARLTTLGGGRVMDPYARRRSRMLPVTDLSPGGLLGGFCAEAGVSGVPLASLPVRLGVPPRSLRPLLNLDALCVTSERVYARDVLDRASGRLLEAIDAAHVADPLSPGLALPDAKELLGLRDDLFDVVVARITEKDAVVLTGAHLHRAGWRARLSESQTALAERMMHAFCTTSDVTTDTRVVELYGPASLPVLRYLEREGSVVRWGEAVVAEPIVRSLVDRLRGHMAPGRRYTPAELRDALGVSRKVLIPLLEHCDRVRVTERHGSERVLRG